MCIELLRAAKEGLNLVSGQDCCTIPYWHGRPALLTVPFFSEIVTPCWKLHLMRSAQALRVNCLLMMHQWEAKLYAESAVLEPHHSVSALYGHPSCRSYVDLDIPTFNQLSWAVEGDVLNISTSAVSTCILLMGPSLAKEYLSAVQNSPAFLCSAPKSLECLAKILESVRDKTDNEQLWSSWLKEEGAYCYNDSLPRRWGQSLQGGNA